MSKLSLIFSALVLQQASAGTAISDFNDNSPGPLGVFDIGAGQGGGTGWLTDDVWANTGTINVIPGDLTAPSSTGYAVTQAPTAQSAQGSSIPARQTTRATEFPLLGTVWFSYLINQPSVDSRGGITFNRNASSPGNPRIVATGTEVRLGLAATLQDAGGGVDLLTLGETALILGRVTIDSTGNPDTLDLWINPDVSGDSTSLPAPDNTLTEETPIFDSGITRIGIQSYSADSQGGIIDSLRVSDAANAFEIVTRDVTILPEDPNLLLSLTNPFSESTLTTADAPITVDIELQNTGSANSLTIEDTSTITGDDAASYTILTGLPFDIAPGASAILQLQLDPAGVARASSASLEIASTDTSSPTIAIPLSTRILGSDGNLLLNGDFEADPTSPINWLSTNVNLVEGIALGSTTSASLAPGANFRQNVSGGADWYLECFFQAPDTADRAFNLLINGPGGNINLRFQGTSAGAEQTWNLFDNATLNDTWGEAIALPVVQPGATYQLRVIGKNWNGNLPTYDLELSAPNSTAVAGIVADLNRFQGATPTGPPNLIRFSSEFGNSPGFIIDDVRFANGTPSPAGPPVISSFNYDPSAQIVTFSFSAQVGSTYGIEASEDLLDWGEIEALTATSESQSVTVSNVSNPQRFYRVRLKQ